MSSTGCVPSVSPSERQPHGAARPGPPLLGYRQTRRSLKSARVMDSQSRTVLLKCRVFQPLRGLALAPPRRPVQDLQPAVRAQSQLQVVPVHGDHAVRLVLALVAEDHAGPVDLVTRPVLDPGQEAVAVPLKRPDAGAVPGVVALAVQAGLLLVERLLLVVSKRPVLPGRTQPGQALELHPRLRGLLRPWYLLRYWHAHRTSRGISGRDPAGRLPGGRSSKYEHCGT